MYSQIEKNYYYTVSKIIIFAKMINLVFPYKSYNSGKENIHKQKNILK